MINYNRLEYGIKQNLITFSEKISKGLTRPKSKFVTQIIYDILAGNKVYLSEIAPSLNEAIRLKKTIWRLSRDLFAFEKIKCKISYILVSLCECPTKNLILVAVYGFWKAPMLLLINLKMKEKKKQCIIAAKIYLMGGELRNISNPRNSSLNCRICG